MSGIGVRLVPHGELTEGRSPTRCVEVDLGSGREEPLRITPTELVRLVMEADTVLAEIRAHAKQAETQWRTSLGHWFEEARAAVQAQSPETAMLQRVLEALRRPDRQPVSSLP
ncbi:hypothetical protein ACGF12_13920 [Kitasatospora sp. NPDC048296]|uniref:hypothetical protein n=1 Tax=Kitasatospora sp. NPDC048296 TaxID=3364048 RepID=UPI00371F38B4